MKKKCNKMLILGVGLLLMFVLWTVLVRIVDVRTIGPRESSVGFATLNAYIHNLTGVNIFLYTLTDWLGLVPIAIALGFAILGLAQLIKRKSLRKVDGGILALGAFYIVVMTVYTFFEVVVINYRPILIDGHLEASYPSSTTMLVMCVMPTAMMLLRTRIQNEALRCFIMLAIVVYMIFMVIGRVLSGVHWITDIIGGALFSAGLVIIYYSINNIVTHNR